MAHFDFNPAERDLNGARLHARQAHYVYRAQTMLVAAGITAVGIVAVAASMMTTLL
jgi:hypothetical protein